MSQRDRKGKERVITYGSHAITSHERGYCITRKEQLAIYYFCNYFKHYLYGRRFVLRTDHKAITFMLNTKKPITAQFQTWINYLSSLDMDLQYRKGELHGNADTLSRPTCDNCVQCQTTHDDAKKGKIKTRVLQELANVEDRDDQLESSEEWRKKELNGEELRKEIGKVHKLLCHAGSEKVKEYMKKRYKGESMMSMIAQIVKSCGFCQRFKTWTGKSKEEVVNLKGGSRAEVLFVDICGPWKETSGGRKYILGMIDQCTKYIVLVALTNQKEESIRRAILELWILKFGCPRVIQTDCGRVFESGIMKSLAESLDISLVTSSPYHHNANGQIERQFRTVREWIKTTMNERGTTDWASLLPEVEFAMNATIHKATAKSPAELMFGRNISRERWYRREDEEEESDNAEIQTKRKVQIGEEVLVKREGGSKDQSQFVGPYRVVKKIHERRYKLQDENGKEIERNIEKIKKIIKEGDVRY